MGYPVPRWDRLESWALPGWITCERSRPCTKCPPRSAGCLATTASNRRMPADHYETLGVSRDAGQDEIKRAFRRLARLYHPDANPNEPEAAERFKEAQHAYEVLSDPEKRRRYDLFGEDRVGAAHFTDFGGISDLFSAFFGGVGGSRRRTGPARGADVLAEVEITLEDAATGC